MRRAAAFVLAALTLAGCASTRPAAPDTASALAAVDAYIAASNAQDWRGVAERVDPDDLAKMMPFVQLMGEMALEDPDAQDVPPPPEDPVGAFAWLMDTMTGQVPMMADMMGTATGDVLGAVAETDSLAHVVMRSSTDMMGVPVSQVTAVTVRLAPDGRWLVKLGGQVDALSGLFDAFETFEGIDMDVDEGPPPPPPPSPRPKPGSDG